MQHIYIGAVIVVFDCLKKTTTVCDLFYVNKEITIRLDYFVIDIPIQAIALSKAVSESALLGNREVRIH